MENKDETDFILIVTKTAKPLVWMWFVMSTDFEKPPYFSYTTFCEEFRHAKDTTNSHVLCSYAKHELQWAACLNAKKSMTQERRIASGTLVETKTHTIGQQARTYISELSPYRMGTVSSETGRQVRTLQMYDVRRWHATLSHFPLKKWLYPTSSLSFAIWKHSSTMFMTMLNLIHSRSTLRSGVFILRGCGREEKKAP